MNQVLDLKALERKAYHSYHQDGLLEICLGLFMLIAILSSTLAESGVADSTRQLIYLPLIVLVPVGYTLGKKYISVPRMGYVKFSPKRVRQRKRTIAIIIIQMIAVIALLIITVGVSAGRWSWPQPLFVMPLLIALGALVGIGILANLGNLPCLYIAAFLLAITEPIYSTLDYYTNLTFIGVWAFGFSCLILLIMGFSGLQRFLSQYPIRSGEVNDER